MTPHPFIIQSTNPFRRCRTLILALVSTFLLGVGFLASAVDADTLTSPIDHPLAHTATVPNEVTVKFVDGTTDQQRRAIERASSTKAEALTGPNARLLRITGNRSVEATIVKLQTNPHVEHVAPNVKARISAFIPDDPGKDGMDGWEKLQWNFIGPTSVNAPQAWENLIRAGRPGGTKVKVAVLDTGVACGKRFRNFIPSPDFKPGLGTCLHGFDFIENNNHPFDRNGHGTHVAGTIAERTNNDLAVTGLAYGAKIPPVRVLDRRGEGDAATIARGIRFAVKRKVSVINLSLEFGSLVRASQIPDVISLDAQLDIVCAYQPVSEPRLRETRVEVPRDLEWMVNPRQEVDRTLNEAAEEAKAANVKVKTFARSGDPSAVILDLAEERKSDLIVVGNKGMAGTRRFLLGSVPNKISHHAPCSVLIVRTT